MIIMTLPLHHMVINHSPTGVTVMTDLDKINLDEEADFWSEVWLWLGAEEVDEPQGSDFHNLTISYTTTSCEQGNKLQKVVGINSCDSKPSYLLTRSYSGF